MLISSALFSAAAIAAVGFIVFWSNPQRSINRLFLGFSLHLTVWLLCVHFGLQEGEDPFWVRMSSSVAAFVPLHMWILKDAYVRGHVARFSERRVSLLRWCLAAVALTILCWSDLYIKPHVGGPGQATHFGVGYLIYMLAELTLFVVLYRQTVVQIRTLSGGSRLELQILLLGVAAAGAAIILLMALRVLLRSMWPIHLQPLMLVLVYTATLIAVTARRIFDARQIVLVVAKNAVLVVTATAIAFGADHVLGVFGVPEPFPLLITVGVTLWIVALENRWLAARLEFYPEAKSARLATFVAMQTETRSERLQEAFRNVLRGWGHSESAVIGWGSKVTLGPEPSSSLLDPAILGPMQELQWVTPERLIRERSTPQRDRVARFMREQSLGVLVIAEGPTLCVLVGVGVSASRVPYTYPQILQLSELASIMESALERAHFAQKVQHTEQLATVGLLGASVAHEIRNPLVSIKTFVQLLPQHHADPAFRDKFFRLIASEVDRIDQLTQQLLDLASPRTYSATTIELHAVLRASMDLVATKAANKDVRLITDFAAVPDTVFTDSAAAKQVVLNLCFNAIQAIENQSDGQRCIWISTRNRDAAVEMVVEDSGPGIAPEMMPRLFQPFQTTKSSGFGLGLAICSDILANLNASISVDPPAPGRGATFRVTFPCQPS